MASSSVLKYELAIIAMENFTAQAEREYEQIYLLFLFVLQKKWFMSHLCKIGLIFVSLLTLCSCVNAFEITDPERRVELQATYSQLPSCERAILDKRLKKVRFTPKIRYPELALSFGFGTTLINDKLEGAQLERAFIHECGHQFDWNFPHRPSEDPLFEAAVATDFAKMSKKKAAENDYLKQPREAWAELFASHFMPLTYGDTEGSFDLDLMPASRKAFLTILDQHCPAELEQ